MSGALLKEDAGRTGHTPLPWVAKALNFGEFELHSGKHEFALIYASDGMDEATPFPAEANAAFIVRAVNSHADLVKATQDLVRRFEKQLTASAEFIPRNILAAHELSIENARKALAKATP